MSFVPGLRLSTMDKQFILLPVLKMVGTGDDD